MAVKFDYSLALNNVWQIISSSNYTSEDIVNPSDAIFFIALFDPGHTGVTTFLEYSFSSIPFYKVSGADGILTYKWQYKPDGGSWTDLVTGATASVTAPNFGLVTDKGVFETPVTLPLEIRLVGTDADATWRLQGLTLSSCLLRAVGSV